MDYQDFLRSKSLNNIPQRKLQEKINQINQEDTDGSTKALKLTALHRYAEANIPIEYWNLKMESDFYGNQKLMEVYQKVSSDIKNHYISGTSYCLAGTHGTGKTMVSNCILKKFLNKGYSGLYTTLYDVVSVLTQADGEEKFTARKELCMVDFLIIDEFDPRFIASDNAADLYARTLETIFRTRSQNKLPTIMCTNSPNVLESFTGTLKASIGSLMSGYLKIIPIIGEDFRKKNNNV